jgi:hypothetical protein
MDKIAIRTQQRLAHDDGVREDAQDVVSGVKVSVTDTLGTIFLGLLALILLVALLRAQKRNRVLAALWLSCTSREIALSARSPLNGRQAVLKASRSWTHATSIGKRSSSTC